MARQQQKQTSKPKEVADLEKVSEEDEQVPNRDDSHEIANRDIKPT